MADSILGTGDTAVSKSDKDSCLRGAYIPVGEWTGQREWI